MVFREHEAGQLAKRSGAGVVRLDAEVVQELAADALDLLRRERRLGEAFDEDPDGLRGRLARAPPLEGEEFLPVVELEGRADPLEAVRELHAGTSWAWNRTTVRCSSTRYVRATARTWSARTFSTFARSVSPNSQEPRPSPAPRRIPWNVTPSCSYRAQARTCWRARASSDFGGGLFWIFSISRSRTASTRSRVAPRSRVTPAINSAGSSFISCRTPTSVARRASTSAR